jgi:hypothetical protein
MLICVWHLIESILQLRFPVVVVSRNRSATLLDQYWTGLDRMHRVLSRAVLTHQSPREIGGACSTRVLPLGTITQHSVI